MHQEREDDIVNLRQLVKRLGSGTTESGLRKMHAAGMIPSISYGAKLGGRRFIVGEVRAALTKLSKPLRPYHPPKTLRAETAGTTTTGVA